MASYMLAISPEELGEYPEGHPKHDPDYDCMKFRVITVEMQKEEEIAEKKLYNHDAAAFIKAVAKANNVGVHGFGRTTTGTSLCSFLNAVLEHRHLRMKKEEDPPNMTLQQRRVSHWKAVIAESCVARDSTLRLVRHVTLMLVGASFDFARQNGQRNTSRDLGDKIEKLRDWFEETDPDDLRAFELLQPKRQPPRAPEGNDRRRSKDKEMLEGNHNSRKRKADPVLPHESIRPKRQRQMGRALPTQRLGDEIEPPRRIAQGKRGKRDWGMRA
ncbi:hypothetical protein LA080_007434 [Diaporthe eres]|uniref:Uncharacterized protein n=1 Tax=Diaporthe vaccinii TaxID=105482 RepID=A0ABR4DTL0_9PEZI|nr:hypothetical protein LA080_007434 [Diaporthe eres]